MLKRKALKKIMITTLTVCLLLAIYLMPSNNNINNNKLQVQYSDNIEKVNIFLLNNDDLLVRATTVVDKDVELVEKVRSILTSLFDSSNSLLPNGLNGIIPKKVKILDVTFIDGIITINLSSDIKSMEEKRLEKMLEAITFSIIELEDVSGVMFAVDGENINKIYSDLPLVFNKDYGINKKYHINNTKNIKKVVIYYIDEINDEKYYVPITKYVDDVREKISIIIDDLSSNYIYEPNLVSYLNQNTELINFELDQDIMILNFNTSIFMNDGEILEEVVYSIGYSVFDSYGVDEVVFEVNNEEILKKTLKDIEFVK